MASVEILPVSIETLTRLVRIPILFEVRTVIADPRDGYLAESEIDPYVKDYDALEDLTKLPDRFDTSEWRLLIATHEADVAGLLLAMDTPGVQMLENRSDIAAIWDLRVAPDHRGQGLGRALWEIAETVAFSHGCLQIKVETQNINVAACRFYAEMGCNLSEINSDAYRDLPHEVQMIWRKDLRE